MLWVATFKPPCRCHKIESMKNLLGRLFVFGLTLCLGTAVGWLPTGAVVITEGTRPLETPTSSLPEREPLLSEEVKSTGVDTPDEEGTQVESFTDDKKIGRRGKNKIEIRCFSRAGGRFAEIKFYSRSEYDAWLEVQSFRFEKDDLTGCNPVIEDFNNDGLSDFSYKSGVAARMSNDRRKLFIYDEERDELVHIKNSEEYPNLAYNKKLNCLDSFMIYGATSTAFLRIDVDRLKEFARVDTGTERVVSVTSKSGKERIIRREKMDPLDFGEVYRRFSTYDPPR